MLVGSTLVGVDIGSSAIRLCQLAEEEGQRRLMRFGVAPLPPQTVVDGSVLDQAVVAEALRGLFAEQGIDERRVALCASGSGVVLELVVLPAMSHEELVEQLQWEMENHIPFDVREMSCGCEVLRRIPERGTMEVLLAAAKLDALQSQLAACEEAELVPRLVSAPGLCLRQAYEASYEPAAGDTVALVDVGASCTTIAIIADGVPRFMRNLARGGDTIVEALHTQLGVPIERAERLALGRQDEDAPPRAEVEQAMAEPCEDLAGAIQRILDFHGATSEGPPIERVLVSGGASELSLLIHAMQRRAGVTVELLEVSRGLALDAPSLDVEAWTRQQARATVALGLALHPRRRSRTRVNLLPGATKRGAGGPEWLWEALDAVPLSEGQRRQVASVYETSQGSLRKMAGAVKDGVDALPSLLQGLRAAVPASKPNAPPSPSPAAARQLRFELPMLAALVDAGLPIVQCIETLAQVAEDEPRRVLWQNVYDQVTQGATLSGALRQHPAAFDSFTVNMVAAGEVGGILDTILARLCEEGEPRQLQRSERALRRSAPDLIAAAAPWLNAGRCCWLLGTLLSCGVPILDSLAIAAEHMDAAWAGALRHVREQVALGQDVHTPLEATRDATGCPPFIVALVRVGEQTGTLDQMLSRGAKLCVSAVADLEEEAATR